MRLYSMRKCLRLKRILISLAVFALLSLGMKMGGLFKKEFNDDYPQMTIKKFEVFKYTLGSFTVGSFLKRNTPGNISFCNFRFGDSESFNYTDSDVSYSPELGDKGPYRVLYGVIKGFKFNSSETNTITYATHVTLKYLFHIVEIATRWGGPISVACFLPGTDAILALKVFEKMCFCVKEMENVNVHFIYHKNHPPKQMSLKNYSIWLDMEEPSDTSWKIVASDYLQNSSLSLSSVKYDDNKTTQKTTKNSCFVPQEVFENSYRIKNCIVYPINVARNVARYGSKSKFILVSDIELLPSDNLVPEFLKMTQRLKEKNKIFGDHYFTKKKHVFVVPVFEVAKNQPDVPRTKAELMELYDMDRAVYFHKYVCIHCQRFPGIQRWLQKKVHPKSKIGIIQPLLVVKREFPYHRWEPIYIGTNDEPLYSELLTWEGQQDKMTQMHEMCLLEYRFVILNGAFLVHTPGIKRKKGILYNPFLYNKINQSRSTSNSSTNINSKSTISDFSTEWRNKHLKRNAYLYQIITQDVMGRYRFNPRCRIH